MSRSTAQAIRVASAASLLQVTVQTLLLCLLLPHVHEAAESVSREQLQHFFQFNQLQQQQLPQPQQPPLSVQQVERVPAAASPSLQLYDERVLELLGSSSSAGTEPQGTAAAAEHEAIVTVEAVAQALAQRQQSLSLPEYLALHPAVLLTHSTHGSATDADRSRRAAAAAVTAHGAAAGGLEGADEAHDYGDVGGTAASASTGVGIRLWERVAVAVVSSQATRERALALNRGGWTTAVPSQRLHIISSLEDTEAATQELPQHFLSTLG